MSKQEWNSFLQQRKKVVINTLVIAINVIVFVAVEIGGSSMDSAHMIEWGAAYTPLIQHEGQFYRLFTAMFLHFGLTHLGNNMLVLVFLGDSLERAVGKFKYLLIYLLGGLGANYLSYWLNVSQETPVVAAGASGAVFAVIGAMIYIVIANRGRLEDLTTGKLVFMAALSIYLGFTGATVDNMAHIGGLVLGFLLGLLLYRKKKYISRWEG